MEQQVCRRGNPSNSPPAEHVRPGDEFESLALNVACQVVYAWRPRRRSQSVPAAFCIYGLFFQGHSAVNETKRAIVFHSATAINYLKAYFLGGTVAALAASQKRLSSSRLDSQVIGTKPSPKRLLTPPSGTSYLLTYAHNWSIGHRRLFSTHLSSGFSPHL